ncbi:VanW family protein [uncultured Actinomyces sp.]|uniref:VanW family protein n=1 Tax=uncultured Actinomyces sp. TaxID=249061 RepID=UPI002625DB0E|nr:VanW family protein [uncultured Actinomyces sp.]
MTVPVPDPNATPSDADDAAVAQPAPHPAPRHAGGTAPDGASASGTASAPSGTAPDGAASAPGGATSGPGGGTASGAGADTKITGTSVTATSSTDAKATDTGAGSTGAAAVSAKAATKKAAGSARSVGPIGGADTEAGAKAAAPAKASTAEAAVPAEGPAETADSAKASAASADASAEAADPADTDLAQDTATPAAGTADAAPTEGTTSDTDDDDTATDSASGSQPAQGRRRWSRRRRTALAVVTGLGILVLLWLGAAWWNTANLAPGSSISGVAVGGMSLSEARQAVAAQTQDVLDDPVTVTVNGSSAQITPSKAGVSVDAQASVERLTRFTLNPATIFNRFTGARVDAVVNVDPVALTGALGSHLDELATGTSNASVILNGTTPVLIPASAGNGVDIAASVRRLTANWPLGKTTIELDAGQARPTITDAAAQAFINDTLNPLLSAPLTITAAGTDAASISAGDVTLSPEQVAGLVTISSSGTALSAALDADMLYDTVVSTMGADVEVAPQSATWTIDGSDEGAPTATPQYVAPANGRVIDRQALADGTLKAGTSSATGRTVTLPLVSKEPALTTAAADWHITEFISDYSTPFYSEPGRDQNLRRGAELLNGKIVMPGQVFSTEEALGEVDEEHGFAAAGVISDGKHVDAIGGGLSQIGTTMFNAAFEAGMDDVEHHPHTYWFSRYPAGREATIWTGEKDVKFGNSTPYPVLIQAWVSGEEVHVRLWSTRYYEVSITSGEKTDYRPVKTVTASGPGCEAYSGGNAGFDITVTRSRKAPDKTVPDDVLTTKYEADNRIVCSK